MKTMRRKYRFSDRAAAESAYSATSHENLLLEWSLADALAGKVHWDAGKHWSIAVMRPDCVSGGWLLVREHCRDFNQAQGVWSQETALRTLASAIRCRSFDSSYYEERNELVRLLTVALRALGRNPDDCASYS
jgi:hypothetical protein